MGWARAASYNSAVRVGPRERSQLALTVIATACVAGGVVLGYWVRGASPPAASSTEAPRLRDVVARCKGAVVGVRALLHPSSAQSTREGSGFVIHGDGLVVTSKHLVTERMLVLVEVPDRGRFLADVVGEDAVTDLAVLRLRGTFHPPLPALEFADSDQVAAGDWVLALGYPLPLGHTVTAGLASSRGRHLPLDDAPISTSLLQFSAAVNPGSSGSPVLDLAGRVVGMTMGKGKDTEGLAFAVPSRLIEWVLARMEEHDGRVPRGWLGVSLAPGPADGRGARVQQVEPDGPGWRAGIRPGDVVVRFCGEPVLDAEDLYDKITQALPATQVTVEVCSQPQAATRTVLAVLSAVQDATPTATTPAAEELTDSSARPERSGASH
jgi:serine protease Do